MSILSENFASADFTASLTKYKSRLRRSQMVSSRIRRARTAVSEATADILMYRRCSTRFKLCKSLKGNNRSVFQSGLLRFLVNFGHMRAIIFVVAVLWVGGCATAPKTQTVAPSEDAQFAIRNQGYT